MDLVIATESIKSFDLLTDVVQSSSYEPLNRIIDDLYKNASGAIDSIDITQANDAALTHSLGDLQGVDFFLSDAEHFGLERYNDRSCNNSTMFENMPSPFTATG